PPAGRNGNGHAVAPRTPPRGRATLAAATLFGLRRTEGRREPAPRRRLASVSTAVAGPKAPPLLNSADGRRRHGRGGLGQDDGREAAGRGAGLALLRRRRLPPPRERREDAPWARPHGRRPRALARRARGEDPRARGRP